VRDGIGPEIMDATLEIILAAGAAIEMKKLSEKSLSGRQLKRYSI
jgi:isocitrate/isopropylmalate dehydrogenase